MSTPFYRPSSAYFRRGSGRDGVALIIVLGCVVLLTAVVLTFLSWATVNREISSAGAGMTTSTLLAHGAVDTIIGDLQEEIVDGSTPPSPAVTANTTNIYLYPPTLPAAAGPTSMVPATAGFTRQFSGGVESDNLQNLIKISAHNTPFFPNSSPYSTTGDTSYLPNGRASSIPSSTPSINGRYVSAARWNRHLLLPLANQVTAGSPATDTTPQTSTTGFTVPNWILVARDGSDTSALTAPPVPTSNKAIIGRYAYAIYDEGGLLDMNVAGSPVNPNTAAPSPWSGYKSALAYADLTQLPGIKDLPANKQAQVINGIVGWRNTASAHASGNFPGYTFPSSTTPSASATSTPNAFESSVLSNFTGFLNVGPDPANTTGTYNNGQTDRPFYSRQALIAFLTQALPQGDASITAAAQLALPYMGTFSRDLNQPSVWPDKFIPKIVSGPGTMAAGGVTGYGGGNDQFGNDTNGTTAQAQASVNPPFLTVRTTGTFQRYDNQKNLPANIANPGDVLVKKRFPLSRLAWITYKGPSATLSSNDPIIQALLSQGISQDMINQGTAANIKQCFGLTWKAPTIIGGGNAESNVGGATGNCWFYQETGLAAQPIQTLAQVATEGREPDFAELLKAAILAGSLGKGSSYSNNVTANSSTTDTPCGVYQQYKDTTVDFQVMQIFANIIDQFDTDSFPTWIQFNNGTTDPASAVKTMRNFYGVEDLPYLQRVYTNMVQVEMPTAPTNPYPTDLNTAAHVNNASFPQIYLPGQATPILTDTGTAVILATPALWNPHDNNTSAPNYAFTNAGGTTIGASGGTFRIRLTAQTLNPEGTTGGMGAYTSFNPYAYALMNDSVEYSAGPPIVTEVGQEPPIHNTTAQPYLNSGHNLTSGTANAKGGSTLETWLGAGTPEFDLYFYPPSPTTLFREPTLLHQKSSPAGSNLVVGGLPGSIMGQPFSNYGSTNGFKDVSPNNGGGVYLGLYAGYVPLRWVKLQDPIYPIIPGATYGTGSGMPTTSVPTLQSGLLAAAPWNSHTGYDVIYTTIGMQVHLVPTTYRLEYSLNGSGGPWQPYDEKYMDGSVYAAGFWNGVGNGNTFTALPGDTSTKGSNDFKTEETAFDPRSSRFGFPYWYTQSAYRTGNNYGPGFQAGATASDYVINNLRPSDQDDISIFGKDFPVGLPGGNAGWFGTFSSATKVGYLEQNSPLLTGTFGAAGPQYYQDPDGVVRRAMGAYYPSSVSNTGVAYQATIAGPAAPGLPMTNGLGLATPTYANAVSSRPIMLNRPFHSVAELGYVFRDDPWKNLDFFTPQSGDAALLDVFCINDDNRPDALVAGKVNINTRQVPVLQAILAGAYKDQLNFSTTFLGGSTAATNEASNIANALVQRTSDTVDTNKGPLRNISELVGKCIQGYTADPYHGNYSTTTSVGYDGFSNDLGNIGSNLPPLYAGAAKSAQNIVQRLRETSMRALSDVGTARVWNLMIDVVAQTGRYNIGANALGFIHQNVDQFTVDGEQHYWVHVAIDRYTGQIIDESVETVKD